MSLTAGNVSYSYYIGILNLNSGHLNSRIHLPEKETSNVIEIEKKSVLF